MSKEMQEVVPRHEHSVPWFWPMAAAIELGEEGVKQFRDNLRFAAEAVEITVSPEPEWSTSNRMVLELDTMRLRDFSSQSLKHTQTPFLVDAPYAADGHNADSWGLSVNRVVARPARKPVRFLHVAQTPSAR